MVKIKITYENENEREKTLEMLRKSFKVVKTSKEYDEGTHKRMHFELS